MTMLPGAPSLHNIVPSTGLGTPLTAAPLIGILTSVAAIIFILAFMKYSLAKSLRKNETFQVKEGTEKAQAIPEDDLPPFLISLLPIVVLLGIILAFSSVDNIIIVALIVAIILSAILFHKQIAYQKEVLNEGATDSLSSTITTGSTIAFGSITTSVPAFTSVFKMIQSIPGPPILPLMIGTGLISGITASAVGAIGISVQNFAPIYLDMGLDPETVHRTIAISSGALAIVPYSGFLIIFNSLAGLSMKETFKNAFISINVTHWLALAVIVAMTLLGLA
ncbi:hypothetical protein [Planococcus maitriensis]|uniref:hypothetical protein n=1 Tax=Planococcus maitriensis TaxID=221799 RepID=UPI00142E70BD|nr:hypothetical protein [Planococcus maitriensis]